MIISCHFQQFFKLINKHDLVKNSQVCIKDDLNFIQFTHLEHDFLHFLVGRLELPDEDQHHFPGVILRVLGVHQRDQVPDGLQERGQPLAPVRPDALPQRLQHAVERLDPVRGGRFGERGQSQSGDGAHLES